MDPRIDILRFWAQQRAWRNGHDLTSWCPIDKEIAVAKCRRCGQFVTVRSHGRAKREIDGCAERPCPKRRSRKRRRKRYHV